jgi:hypothetical protein
MPTWRQARNGKLIPIEEWDEDLHSSRGRHYIHGDLEEFRSPIDGSIIRDRKQLREHNKKHDVVCAEEFPQSHYDQAAKRRANHYQGVTSKAETFKRRQAIHEIITRAERDGRQ